MYNFGSHVFEIGTFASRLPTQTVNTPRFRFLFVFLFATAISLAQTTRKYSNEFMNIGVDSRALAMSNAVTAHVSDVTASYWNPAGLIGVERDQLALMHASYFANIAQYDYVGYAKNIDDRSAFGFSLIRFGVDDILNTTQLIDSEGNIDYNRISLFSTADYGLTFSYARKLQVPGLQYGISAKIIRRVIGNFASSWGVGFDVGLQFERSGWKFGVMARDVTTTYNVWTIDEDAFRTIANAVPGQNQEVPESTEITLPKLQVGMAKLFEFHNETSLLASANLNTRFEQTNDLISGKGFSVDPALGFEYGYTDLVFARAGVGNFQNITQLDGSKRLGFQPNIGLGFKYRGIQVDYALTDLGDQSAALYSNIFSLKVDLDVFRR